jgi:phosphoserine phosphatase RsbU/P
MSDTPTILIVDDDPTTIVLLESIFQQEGYRTLSAFNGAAARTVLSAQRPDIILLDVQMPGENGFDLCRRLHADSETSDIPILFLSAEDDIASRVSGLTAGAVDYVTKPFSRAEVMARVRTHLRLSRAYRALVLLQSERLAQVAVAQQAILPRPERFPDAHFSVAYRPLLQAGGDYYDVLPVGEQVFDYLVADVSGHDPGTALSTAALKALLHQNASITDMPARALQTINGVLRSVLPDGQFLTLVYARLNRTARRATIVHAGHPPALYVPRAGVPRLIEQNGDILGAFECVAFEQCELSVSPGDRIYLMTDGLLEITNELALNHRLGIDAVLASCERARALPLDAAVDHVVRETLGSHAMRDDVVLLGIEV